MGRAVFTQQSLALAQAGLRMAVIGASIEARAHPIWGWDKQNYQRINGVVTLTFNYSQANQRFLPGHLVRPACPSYPGVEGAFEVLTSSIVAGTSGTITYNDPRPDIAANSLPGGGDLHDLHAYTISSAFQPHINIGVGGRVDIVTVATGGTNLVTDWGEERVAQVAAQGPFTAVLIGCGLLGNTVKGYGAGPAAAYAALKSLVELIKARVQPRMVFVETMPLSRAVRPNEAAYTASLRLNRMIWRDLQREYAYVRVITGGESMVQNYSAYNVTPPVDGDYVNGWPETNSQVSDGVHSAYAWARVRGLTIADSILPHIARWTSPEMGMVTDSAQVNSVVDAEGNRNPNLSAGLWGNVDATKVTLTGTGISGVGPAGASVAFPSGRGTSTVVGSLRTNPAGGADWVLTINGNGSTSGYTLNADYAPSWLLTELNSVAVQGRRIDWFQPLTVRCGENKLIHVSVELIVTVGGVDYVLASPQANLGQYTQAAIQRGVDGGYSGVLRAPRFKVPSATYEAAKFRIQVREVNGSVVSGKTVIVMGPGQRFEMVD